uniref:Uncharacterized protein n=1 Tax=Steinernema glaseri TaxID=37863 RepID=A0A1I8A880_9BILA
MPNYFADDLLNNSSGVPRRQPICIRRKSDILVLYEHRYGIHITVSHGEMAERSKALVLGTSLFGGVVCQQATCRRVVKNRRTRSDDVEDADTYLMA